VLNLTHFHRFVVDRLVLCSRVDPAQFAPVVVGL
jgi:hypothetical protein